MRGGYVTILDGNALQRISEHEERQIGRRS
jgi:hypothetical protein